MFRCTTVALVAAATALALSSARPSHAQPAGPAAAFEPLSFLAGYCWQGAFKDRPSVTDEHCFEWVYGDKFLRDRHIVRGDAQPYEGETLYAWHPETRRIIYWYIARPGFHSTGHVEARDGQLLFIDSLRQAAGKRDLLSIWTRTGADTISVRTEERTGGAVKELWAMEMRRVGRAKGQP